MLFQIQSFYAWIIMIFNGNNTLKIISLGNVVFIDQVNNKQKNFDVQTRQQRL